MAPICGREIAASTPLVEGAGKLRKRIALMSILISRARQKSRNVCGFAA